jgi:hypothetical protein
MSVRTGSPDSITDGLAGGSETDSDTDANAAAKIAAANTDAKTSARRVITGLIVPGARFVRFWLITVRRGGNAAREAHPESQHAE